MAEEDVPYSYWRDEVISQVGGAFQPAVNLAIKNTIRDFLLRTRVWHETLTPSLTAGRSYAYLVPPFESASLAFLLKAYWQGADILTNFTDPADYTTRGTGSISAVRFSPPNRIELLETPSAATSTDLECVMSLVPFQGSVVVPDVLETHYFEEILAGSLERLYRQPDKPYTNPEMAKMYRLKYTQGITTARQYGLSGYSQSEVPFKFNPF